MVKTSDEFVKTNAETISRILLLMRKVKTFCFLGFKIWFKKQNFWEENIWKEKNVYLGLKSICKILKNFYMTSDLTRIGTSVYSLEIVLKYSTIKTT